MDQADGSNRIALAPVKEILGPTLKPGDGELSLESMRTSQFVSCSYWTKVDVI